jgi:hypothetical protein
VFIAWKILTLMQVQSTERVKIAEAWDFSVVLQVLQVLLPQIQLPIPDVGQGSADDNE